MAAEVDNGQPGEHIGQGHHDQRGRPGSRAGDVVRDAECGDGRAGAVGRGEVEDHPGPDAAIHMPAARVPARPSGRPSAPGRSRVARPPIAPMAAPADTHSRSSAMSLPPPGTE